MTSSLFFVLKKLAHFSRFKPLESPEVVPRHGISVWANIAKRPRIYRPKSYFCK